MKGLFTTILLALMAFALSPSVSGQNCSNLTNWDLRGAYLMSGSGFLDLSKIFPGKDFPSGMNPMSFVGGHVLNGAGGGTGWISMNIGGMQFNPEYSDYAYAVKSDCSVVIKYNLTFKEVGNLTLPFTRIAVVVQKAGSLEIHSLSVGKAPGTALGGGVNLNVLHRVSMQYW